jgi:hypothetical protein
MIVSFAARAKRQGVVVSWRAATGVQTLGFNVWRAAGPDARGWKRLNPRLIAAKRPGSTYTYVDRSVRRGPTYVYKLEIVGVSGTIQWAGPVRVSGGA